MYDFLKPNEKSDAVATTGESVDRDGKYVFEVLNAHDSYKVNPEDVGNPRKNRRIGLRLKVIEPVRMSGKFPETQEEFDARFDQVGRVVKTSVWLGSSSVKVIEANIQLLVNIAGADEEGPDEELIEACSLGKDPKTGKPQMNLHKFADEIHINCSAFLGRRFVGEIEETSADYPRLHPWQNFMLSEEHQTAYTGKIPKTGGLFHGEDTASQDFIDFLAKQNGGGQGGARGGSQGGDGAVQDTRAPQVATPASPLVEDDFSFDEDAELPF